MILTHIITDALKSRVKNKKHESKSMPYDVIAKRYQHVDAYQALFGTSSPSTL